MRLRCCLRCESPISRCCCGNRTGAWSRYRSRQAELETRDGEGVVNGVNRQGKDRIRVRIRVRSSIEVVDRNDIRAMHRYKNSGVYITSSSVNALKSITMQ
jgi:hypothetical protein